MFELCPNDIVINGDIIKHTFGEWDSNWVCKLYIYLIFVYIECLLLYVSIFSAVND